MVKKFKIIVAMLLAVLTLSSCAEMPESLKESEPKETAPAVNTAPATDEVGDTIGMETAVQPAERGNVDTIRAQLDYDLQKTYKNITVERARVGEGSVMPTYDVMAGRAEDFDVYAFAEYIFGDKYDVHDESLWRHSKVGDPYYDDEPVTTEPTKNADGTIIAKNSLPYDLDAFRPNGYRDEWLSTVSNSTGAMWGSAVGDKIPESTYYHDSFTTVGRYDTDYEEIPKDLSYTMYDGADWNLKEAIAFVENFYNTEVALSDPEKFTYSVKTVFVKALPRDTFGYLFQMQKQDENGNFFDTDRDYYSDENAVKNDLPFLLPNNIVCWCSEKEVLTRYIKDFSFKKEAATDGGDDLLTLGAAADLLSSKLASNANLTLTAELNYVPVCKDYIYWSMWEYPAYYKDEAIMDCELEIRPYWCFKTGASAFSGEQPEMYFVDAVTGELIAMAYGRTERR